MSAPASLYLVFVDDRTLLYLAEVLKMEVPALIPKREAGHHLHEFMELLGKTRF